MSRAEDASNSGETMQERYERAVEKVAGRLNITPEELKRRLNEVRETMPQPSHECLTLWELQTYPTLSSNRLEHVDRCDFCKLALGSMAPTVDEGREALSTLMGSDGINGTRKSGVVSGREIFRAQLEAHMLESELENVMTGYIFSKYGHRTQEREGGGRYFEHPKAVANIIIQELNLRTDWRIIVVALLHDILEDSWLLTESRLEKNFGRDVAFWVKCLTKNPKEGYHDRLRENGSWQVLLVKLCDRLHNLRTLGHCSISKQKRQIEETKGHYVPLADLLLERIPEDKKHCAVYLKDQIEKELDRLEGALRAGEGA